MIHIVQRSVTSNLSTLLNSQFKDFKDGVQAISCFDPKNCMDKKDYGNNAITSFSNYFKATLAAIRNDSTKVLKKL